LVDILNWGTNVCELDAAGVDMSYHQDTIDLLVAGIGLGDQAKAPLKLPFSKSSNLISTKSESILLIDLQPERLMSSSKSPIAV
jgi:hypothetical protein